MADSGCEKEVNDNLETFGWSSTAHHWKVMNYSRVPLLTKTVVKEDAFWGKDSDLLKKGQKHLIGNIAKASKIMLF